MYCLTKMLLREVILALILASALADTKDASQSTTLKTPALNTRFFGLDGFLGNLFSGHQHNPSYGGFGGHFQQTPYPVQQNPQDDWQNIRYPQQFPNQGQGSEQQSNIDRPMQTVNQGNSGSGFGPGGTLDDIPSQGGMQNQNGGGQMGFQNENQFPSNQMGFQNQFPGNQMGSQNQFPGNQMGSQTQFPGNQMGSQNQFPGNQMGSQNPFPGNQMGSQNQFPGNQNQQGTGGNDPVGFGKPVAVPPTSGSDSIVFQDGLDTPLQRQCVQECESTSEYSPVCGSNNITYFNPGRFICARNCGLNVFLRQPGRCF